MKREEIVKRITATEAKDIVQQVLIERLVMAANHLDAIARADYRGNRPAESYRAEQALKEMGLWDA